MRSASDRFGEEDRRRVAEAVEAAEMGGSAEIVPVVATDSGRYDRAEDLVGLVTSLGGLMIAWLLFQREDPTAGGWDGLRLALGLPVLVIVILAGFVLGAVMAMRWAWLRRLFTARRERDEEVHRRATQLFFDRRIHHAPSASGLLVYLSLFERRAVILADERVFASLGQEALDELCAGLVRDVRRGDVTAALCDTIERVGAMVREQAAPDTDRGHATGDEGLRDALITID